MNFPIDNEVINDIVVLVFNDGELIFNKEQYSQFFDTDNFLSLMVKYPNFSDNNVLYDNKNKYEKYFKDKNKNIVRTLIDSIRFNKLILYDNVNLYYVLNLGKMWGISDNILNLIQEKIDKKEHLEFNNIKEDDTIYQCKICSVGFKQGENHNKACISHKNGYSNIGEPRWYCCGKPLINYTEYNNSNKYIFDGCIIGYHIKKN